MRHINIKDKYHTYTPKFTTSPYVALNIVFMENVEDRKNIDLLKGIWYYKTKIELISNIDQHKIAIGSMNKMDSFTLKESIGICDNNGNWFIKDFITMYKLSTSC